jgi:hypothetical protein
MGLTIKDFFATILLIAVLGIFYAHIRGIQIPFINNSRWAILALGILGIMMCAIGTSPTFTDGSIFKPILSTLGITSLGIIIIGLIWGGYTPLLLLTGILVLLYLTTTLRHALNL